MLDKAWVIWYRRPLKGPFQPKILYLEQSRSLCLILSPSGTKESDVFSPQRVARGKCSKDSWWEETVGVLKSIFSFHMWLPFSVFFLPWPLPSGSRAVSVPKLCCSGNFYNSFIVNYTVSTRFWLFDASRNQSSKSSRISLILVYCSSESKMVLFY